MQTMTMKEDKNPHLCYDATTTGKPTNIVMHQVTSVACEAGFNYLWKGKNQAAH